MLSNLRHGNIIGLLGACTDSKKCFLLTELMHNGTLFSVLHERRVQLTTKQRQDIVLGMLMGMNNMHMRRVYHRDLKSANILIDAHFTPKIADFGFAKQKSAAKAKELFQSKVGLSSLRFSYCSLICNSIDFFRSAHLFGWHQKFYWAKNTILRKLMYGVSACLCLKPSLEKSHTPRPVSRLRQRLNFVK